MTENILVRLFEHNHWANLQILQACLKLTDAQLDAIPQSATKGTIRQTLIHLVSAQRGYLALLTLPLEARPAAPVPFLELQESLEASGQGLLAMARGESKHALQSTVPTRDGYHVAPWVVMVQVINHAAEHREQINSLLSAQGITPPSLGGWSYGEVEQAVLPIAQ